MKRISKARLSKTNGQSGALIKNKVDQKATESGSHYSKEELDHALLESFDLMQRVLLDAAYVLVGEGARCLKENRGLDCDKLEFIIEAREVNPMVISTLKSFATPDVRDNGFNWKVGNVPLYFKFVKGDYPYFRFADYRMYGPEQYKIPNQWSEYWKHKDEIV